MAKRPFIGGSIKFNGRSTPKRLSSVDVDKFVQYVLDDFKAGGIPINKTALKIVGRIATGDQVERIQKQNRREAVLRRALNGASGGSGSSRTSSTSSEQARRKRKPTGRRRSSTDFDELNK